MLLGRVKFKPARRGKATVSLKAAPDLRSWDASSATCSSVNSFGLPFALLRWESSRPRGLGALFRLDGVLCHYTGARALAKSNPTAIRKSRRRNTGYKITGELIKRNFKTNLAGSQASVWKVSSVSCVFVVFSIAEVFSCWSWPMNKVVNSIWKLGASIFN